MSKKILLIMRHGKADGKFGGHGDLERPLTDLGRKRTALVANELLKKKILPQFIITSPAARALQTVQYLAELISFDETKICINDDRSFSEPQVFPP